MFTREILMSSIFASAVALSGGLALAATAPAPATHLDNGSSHMQSAGNLAKQCGGLETAFDQAINGHENMKAFRDAKALREEGGQMCAQGAHAAGIHYLKTALAKSAWCRGCTERRQRKCRGRVSNPPSEFNRKKASRHRGRPRPVIQNS